MSERFRWFAYIQTSESAVALGIYHGTLETCLRRAKSVQHVRGIVGAVCLTVPGRELPDPELREIINSSHWRALAQYRKNQKDRLTVSSESVNA